MGLGNPGKQYANTRHNVGWMCLDLLEERGAFGKVRRDNVVRVTEGILEGERVVLAQPQTYMNLSGEAGKQLVQRFPVEPPDVIVVHDDIDLAFGRVRIRRGGSAAGQRGVQSLIDTWRTPDFIRVRIGIGRPERKADVVDFVLDRFRPDERADVDALLERAADAVCAVVRDGLDNAMTIHNRAP